MCVDNSDCQTGSCASGACNTFAPSFAPTLLPTALMEPLRPLSCGNDTGCFVNPLGTYRVAWVHDRADATVQFNLCVGGQSFEESSFIMNGWLGIGINTAPSMVGGDLYIAIPSSGVVTDRYASRYFQPELDSTVGGTDDILSSECSSQPQADSDCHVACSFTRKLNTLDSETDAALDGQQQLYLLWALGNYVRSDGTIGKHTTSGTSSFNFSHDNSAAAAALPSGPCITSAVVGTLLSTFFIINST